MNKKKIFKRAGIGLLVALAAAFSYFFAGRAPVREDIVWGVNFSQKHAQDLGLDWKETYRALLSDLGARHVKTAFHWDVLEPKKDDYNFQDSDWQIAYAKEKGALVIPVIGRKTSRWPECHIPEWAKRLSKEEEQQEVLELVEILVRRYKDNPAVLAWQVENEPFFPFGECMWSDDDFLKQEVALVKSLDPTRDVMITDSGEGSFWTGAAKIGDVVGVTMYRKVWVSQLGLYVQYPIPPVFYWRKAQIISGIFGKEVIGAELQAEPWGPKLLYDISLEEQKKTMDAEQFKKNIAYAKKSGLSTHYLWGGEWWYWMKTKQNDASIWDEARTLFQH